MLYTTATSYIQSSATLIEKVQKIDAIIEALENLALKSAEGADISKYMLNDGQTTISTEYRSPLEITNSLYQYEKIRQGYLNKLDGRCTKLIDKGIL